jgi:hypothetical protein
MIPVDPEPYMPDLATPAPPPTAALLALRRPTPWEAAATLVERHPGLTIAELAQHARAETGVGGNPEHDHYDERGQSIQGEAVRFALLAQLFAARASGALVNGPVRRCTLRQRRAQTWLPVRRAECAEAPEAPQEALSA